MTATPAGETIFALSSGSPPAAIAVVRISGPAAADAVAALGVAMPPARRATLAALRDRGGDLLDRALLLWFPGPGSSTGEDLVELHLHGGRATVAAVLSVLGTISPLRPAEPGEFTRRALENGQLDLAQVEGLGDLLAAETEAQRRNALRLAEGGLTRRIEAWRRTVLDLAAEIEAAIEFGEEDGIAPAADLPRRLRELHEAVVAALAVPPAERLREGIRIVIAGPTNSGKSTLINRLAGRDVAIATPIAGTTRDLIEAPVIIGGTACILIDSAGLRDTADEVERIGIARSRDAVAAADIVLWLGEAPEMPPGNVIPVTSRCDLDDGRTVVGLRVSAITGEGIAALKGEIIARAAALLPRTDQLALVARQRRLLSEFAGAILAASQHGDLVLCAAEMASARTILDRVTGRADIEDMLDALFARFCIGK